MGGREQRICVRGHERLLTVPVAADRENGQQPVGLDKMRVRLILIYTCMPYHSGEVRKGFWALIIVNFTMNFKKIKIK